jgi:hypothetical protein
MKFRTGGCFRLYLATTPINMKEVSDEIIKTINSEIACNYSVQKLTKPPILQNYDDHKQSNNFASCSARKCYAAS